MKKDRYEFYVVKTKDQKIRLHIIADCPLAHKQQGQCSDCNHFLGLNPVLEDEGYCGVFRFLKPIDDFRAPRKCPEVDKRRGECTTCPHFLGFSEDIGFYCYANKKK